MSKKGILIQLTHKMYRKNKIKQEIFEESEITPISIEDPIKIHVKEEKLYCSESKNETYEQKRNCKKQGAADIKSAMKESSHSSATKYFLPKFRQKNML